MHDSIVGTRALHMVLIRLENIVYLVQNLFTITGRVTARRTGGSRVPGELLSACDVRL